MSERLTSNKKARQTSSFKDVYDNLPNQSPKGAFIEKIATLTLKSENTVRMWLCGRQTPDALTQQIISNELGISKDELFPKVKEDELCQKTTTKK